MFALRTWFSRCSTTLAGSACVLALAPVALAQRTDYVEVAFVVIFVIISRRLHAGAHAGVAGKGGDATAKDLGRITLNPIASIDPFMTVILPLMLAVSGAPVFGGAKPVPVSYHRLRHPLRDMMLVAIAGPLTNLVLAIVFMFGWKVAVHLGDMSPRVLLPRVLAAAVSANLWLAVFNMLPIPPLDGSRVMAWLLPPGVREPYVYIERFGLLLVFGFVLLMRNVPAILEPMYAFLGQLNRSLDFMTGGTW